jgi:hypothetical protein
MDKHRQRDTRKNDHAGHQSQTTFDGHGRFPLASGGLFSAGGADVSGCSGVPAGGGGDAAPHVAAESSAVEQYGAWQQPPMHVGTPNHGKIQRFSTIHPARMANTKARSFIGDNSAQAPVRAIQSVW